MVLAYLRPGNSLPSWRATRAGDRANVTNAGVDEDICLFCFSLTFKDHWISLRPRRWAASRTTYLTTVTPHRITAVLALWVQTAELVVPVRLLQFPLGIRKKKRPIRRRVSFNFPCVLSLKAKNGGELEVWNSGLSERAKWIQGSMRTCCQNSNFDGKIEHEKNIRKITTTMLVLMWTKVHVFGRGTL